MPIRPYSRRYVEDVETGRLYRRASLVFRVETPIGEFTATTWNWVERWTDMAENWYESPPSEVVEQVISSVEEWLLSRGVSITFALEFEYKKGQKKNWVTTYSYFRVVKPIREIPDHTKYTEVSSAELSDVLAGAHGRHYPNVAIKPEKISIEALESDIRDRIGEIIGDIRDELVSEHIEGAKEMSPALAGAIEGNGEIPEETIDVTFIAEEVTETRHEKLKTDLYHPGRGEVRGEL